MHSCARVCKTACGGARLHEAARGRAKLRRVARACARPHQAARARGRTRLQRLQVQQEGRVLQQHKGGQSCDPTLIVTSSGTTRGHRGRGTAWGEHEDAASTAGGDPAPHPQIPQCHPLVPHSPLSTPPHPSHPALNEVWSLVSVLPQPGFGGGGTCPPSLWCDSTCTRVCARAERCHPPPCAHTRVHRWLHV